MNYVCRICQANLTVNGICPNCGFDASVDYRSFPTLLDKGIKQPLFPAQDQSAEKLSCKVCGCKAFSIMLEKGIISCALCGHVLGKGELPAFLCHEGRTTPSNSSEIAPQRAEIRDRLVMAGSQNNDSTWRCECGYKNDARRKYCENCDAPRKAPVIEKQANTSWTCICGYRNAPERRFCEKCDHPRRYYF